jgi:hypothetical protein
MTQYRCKYFKIKELVHPSFLGTNENILWRLFDERVLKGADRIRELYGACTVNADGLTDCGLRKMDSKTGAVFSAHKFGRGLDLHIRTIEQAAAKIKDPVERKKFKIKEYNKVRERLMLMPEFDYLVFENGISWLHIAVENRDDRLFNP